MGKGIKKIAAYFSAEDLTSGNVAKGILRFLIPIILSLFFQQIYTLVDSIIVGQTLGEVDVSAVNNATNIVYLLLNFASGAMSGFGVVVGEAVGSKDMAKTRRTIVNQIYLLAIMTAVLTVIGVFSIDPLLSLIGIAPSDSDPLRNEIYRSAHIYLSIIFGGMLTQIFYNHIVSVLRAKGDSFTPFCFLLVSTALNICLDLLFIKVFYWGVAGAAAATVFAQGLAALACYVYAYWRYKDLRPTKEDFKWDGEINSSSLRNGLPLGFALSILAIGIIVMQSAVNRFDISPSGAAVTDLPAELGYGVGCKILNFFMVPMNALGMAMLNFHSQNLGARNLDRIKRGFISSLFIGLAIYLVVLAASLLLTINGAYQYIFLSRDKITEASITYGNAYIYVAMPPSCLLIFLLILRNTLQGLEIPLPNFLSGVAELLARVIICVYLPMALNNMNPTNSESPLSSYIGAALGDPLAWLAATLVMVVPCFLAIYGKKNAIVRMEEKERKRRAN